MARIRKDGTILLNDVQFATYQELQTKAIDGVIHRDVIATYKANVIRGIAKHGAMKTFGKANAAGLQHYKLVASAVVILQPAPIPRSEAVTEVALKHAA